SGVVLEPQSKHQGEADLSSGDDEDCEEPGNGLLAGGESGVAEERTGGIRSIGACTCSGGPGIFDVCRSCLAWVSTLELDEATSGIFETVVRSVEKSGELPPAEWVRGCVETHLANRAYAVVC